MRNALAQSVAQLVYALRAGYAYDRRAPERRICCNFIRTYANCLVRP